MLGKGLESLIPPNRGAQPNNQPPHQANQPGQPAGAQPVQPSSLQPIQPQSTQVQPMQSQPQPIQQEPIQSKPIVQPVQSTQPASHTPPQTFAPRIEKQNERPNNELPPLEKVFAPIVRAMATAQRNDEPIQGSIFQIEVAKIRSNPNQPRREFNQDAIRDLASSIREFGILQPLVVTKTEHETPNGLDVEYELIAGERRLMASKTLGLRVVPAIIRNVNLEREKLELAVIENIQRENLNAIETARAFQRLQEEFKLTQREVASKLGKSRETVANSVRLLDLPPYIQDALQKGELSESHGRLLLAVDDPAVQRKLFEEITLNRLTTRDVKERVERMKRGSYGEREETELPPEVKALKELLSQSIGAPVEIKQGANTGKISITFYSPEELENILRRLGKENF